MDQPYRFRSMRVAVITGLAPVWLVTVAQPPPSATDTNKVRALNDSAFSLLSKEPERGLRAAQEALAISRTSGWRSGEVRSLISAAQNLTALSRYDEALQDLNAALALAQAEGFELLEMKTRIALGLHYSRDHDYPQALEHYQLTEALAVQLNDTLLRSSAMGNMGAVYFNLKLYPEALERYRGALLLNRAAGNERSTALNLGNIGMVWSEQDRMDSAHAYFTQALVLNRKVNNRTAIGQNLTNLGRVSARMGDHQQALAYFAEAMDIFKDMGDRYRMGWVNMETGRSMLALGHAQEAIDECSKALVVADEVKKMKERHDACACLASAYKATGRPDLALRYMEETAAARDSLERSEGRDAVSRLTLNHAVEQQHLKDSLEEVAATRIATLRHGSEMAAQKAQKRLFLVGGIALLGLAAGLWNRLRFMRRSRAAIQQEKDISEGLLLNILPGEVAAELKAKGHADAKHFNAATILFTDFKDFTRLSEQLSPGDLLQELNTCFHAFDDIITARGIEKIKTIGDAYMCAGGLPVPASSTPAGVVQAALEMQAFMVARRNERDAQGLPAFEMRVGIHTGPVVAGIVGVKKFQYDIWGDTVNTASRMESSGEVGQVNISESTYALVKDEPGLTFTPRGKVQAKGKGEMEMYFVANP